MKIKECAAGDVLEQSMAELKRSEFAYLVDEAIKIAREEVSKAEIETNQIDALFP